MTIINEIEIGNINYKQNDIKYARCLRGNESKKEKNGHNTSRLLCLQKRRGGESIKYDHEYNIFLLYEHEKM